MHELQNVFGVRPDCIFCILLYIIFEWQQMALCYFVGSKTCLVSLQFKWIICDWYKCVSTVFAVYADCCMHVTFTMRLHKVWIDLIEKINDDALILILKASFSDNL